jgi:hypothetical protein
MKNNYDYSMQNDGNHNRKRRRNAHCEQFKFPNARNAQAGQTLSFVIAYYSQVLSDTEAAAVPSHVRASWGSAAQMLTPSEVNGYREVPLDQIFFTKPTTGPGRSLFPVSARASSVT